MTTTKLCIVIQYSIFLIILMFSGSVFAQTELKEGIQFVNLDGYKYELKFQGKQHIANGVPVVVFESGAGGGRLKDGSWTAVLDSVAQFAPVFSYSRSGLGNSEWNGIEPTAKNSAMLLHKLLTKLELPKPFVLVGHSWGGAIIRGYGGLYDEEVKALIFVDPINFMQTEEEYNEVYANLGVNPKDAEKFHTESLKIMASKFNLPEGMNAETDALNLFEKQSVEERDLGIYPKKPMVLLYGTKEFETYPPVPEGVVKPWDDDHEWFKFHIENRIKYFSKWSLIFKDLYVVISPNAWHHFQLDEPEIVLDMIKKMIEN